jgi:hypothetical protein
MREENRKHGRSSTGRKHRGNDSKRGKRRVAPKRVHAPPSLPEIAAAAKPFAGQIEAPSIPAPLVEVPQFGASPTAASEAPLEGAIDTEAVRRTVAVGSAMRRGTLAVIACVMVAVGGVALVRACEANGTPTENDAAETGSCSDDAAMCVARA